MREHVILEFLSRSVLHDDISNARIATESNNADDKSKKSTIVGSTEARRGSGSTAKLSHCENSNQSMNFSSLSSAVCGRELACTTRLNSRDIRAVMSRKILAAGGSSGPQCAIRGRGCPKMPSAVATTAEA